MARQKEFDLDVALDKATQLFWEKGFESTSMQDLVDAMGINRASLYDSFGGKKELFDASMDRYAIWMRDEILAPLRKSGPVRKVLGEFFKGLIDQLCSPGSSSCLMVKSVLVRGLSDADTRARVKTFMKSIEDSFADLLQRARTQGEIAEDKNPRSIARFLTTLMSGFNVSSRINPNKRAMGDVVRQALTTLD